MSEMENDHDPEAETGGEACPLPEAGEMDALKERLGKAELEAKNQYDAYLRAMAEMENLRKRTARELQQTRKFALEHFARDLLPVADNLERAMTAMGQTGGEGDDPRLKTLTEGVRMVQNELSAILGRHGVTRVEAMNQPFDPNFHQAMMEMDSEQSPGTVVMEMQPGYMLHERLLRPAMVAVARGA